VSVAVAARPHESGVGWIGEIPSHWEVKPLSSVARLATGHTPSRKKEQYWQNCTIPWFTLADVGVLRSESIDLIETTKEMVSEVGVQNSAARLLPAGTVILSRTASVGFSGILAVPMATTQDFVNWICGPRLLPRYLLYCLRSMGDEFRRVAGGSTHQTIYWPDVERLRIPLPPLDEQEAMAAYLEAERGRIASLIAVERRVLELVADRAEALVSSVILGEGQPPTCEDPAYGWLPPLREGWRLVPLKHLAPFISRGNSPGYVTRDATPVINQACIYWEGLRLEKVKQHDGEIEGMKGHARREDVLVNSTGTGTLGRAAVFDEEGDYLVDGHVTIVRPKRDLLRPRFLVHLLRTAGYRAFVENVLTMGSTDQVELSRDKLAAAPILLPPPDVQDEIVEHLARELAAGIALRERTRRHLALLTEYRQSLTYSVVTGRRRVVPDGAPRG
jgi:type I restriction enzyme S subunit